MKRQTFILQAGLAADGSITTVARAAERIADTTKPPGSIRWKRTSSSSLYSSVVCDGEPLVEKISQPGISRESLPQAKIFHFLKPRSMPIGKR